MLSERLRSTISSLVLLDSSTPEDELKEDRHGSSNVEVAALSCNSRYHLLFFLFFSILAIGISIFYSNYAI